MLHRRKRVLGLSQYRLIKYSIILGVLAVLFVASFSQRSIDASAPISMSAASIIVVDGDTIRTNGQLYRLVGFDTPESGSTRALWARTLPSRRRNEPPSSTRRQRPNGRRTCPMYLSAGDRRDAGMQLRPSMCSLEGGGTRRRHDFGQ